MTRTILAMSGSQGEQGNELEWSQLTNLHPHASEFEIGETEIFRWKGADGWDMQGLLIRPVGGDSDQPVPLVMNVHGGPTGVSGSGHGSSKGWNQLLATEGCAVFMPNYRGSVGWGRTFSESNLGDMGGKDWEDMMLGIDALIDVGIADPDRLAITGWSCGGFIATWTVSQTDRFKASVMGAGISHWLQLPWEELPVGLGPAVLSDQPIRSERPVPEVLAGHVLGESEHSYADPLRRNRSGRARRAELPLPPGTEGQRRADRAGRVSAGDAWHHGTRAYA